MLIVRILVLKSSLLGVDLDNSSFCDAKENNQYNKK